MSLINYGVRSMYAGPKKPQVRRQDTLPSVDPAHHWAGCFAIRRSALFFIERRRLRAQHRIALDFNHTI